jgi:sodium/potassium-transporting ATPase subunit alpha
LDRCIHDIQPALANQSASIPASMKSLVEIARLCNGASFVDTDESASIDKRAIKGDATDTAILRFAEVFADGRHGIDVATMVESHDKLFEIPFNSKNKWMLTIIRERKVVSGKPQFGEPWMLVKGAPDVLFPVCSAALNADGSVVPFGSHALRRISVLQSEWSSEGQRVLALCKRSLAGVNVDFNLASANDVEEMMYSQLLNLTLVGLIGIQDPPRADVEEVIQIIRRAG